VQMPPLLLANTSSFPNIPDEIIEDIFEYLDCRSRCRMRLNKRLHQIEANMMKMEDRELLRIHYFERFLHFRSSKDECRRAEQLTIAQAIHKIGRLLSIFNFQTIKV
ncbi:hypothetical protein PMAYCL1PPCAC_05055, partial [Pristionchus mayeri]